jgi:hypothetical protein
MVWMLTLVLFLGAGLRSAFPMATNFYEFAVIAASGSNGVIGVGAEVSVNDRGTVAYTAVNGQGSGLWKGDGTAAPLQLSPELTTPTRHFGYPQINNVGEVVARDVIAGSPPGYLIRKWSQSGASESIVLRINRNAVLFPSLNDDGDVSYVELDTRSDPSNDTTRLLIRLQGDLTNSMASFAGAVPLRPLCASGSLIVVKAGDAPAAPVSLFDGINPLAPARILSEGFSKVGSSPGISDDGSAIAFVGVRDAGRGVYLYLNQASPTNRTLTRIAGAARNELGLDASDPGYYWHFIDNDNKFAEIDLDSRVGVIHYAKPPDLGGGDRYVVTFLATPKLESTSPIKPFRKAQTLWSVFVDADRGSVVSNRFQFMPVIQVGDVIAGASVTNIALHDPISSMRSHDPTDGVGDHYLAFWVNTDKGSRVVRAAWSNSMLLAVQRIDQTASPWGSTTVGFPKREAPTDIATIRYNGCALTTQTMALRYAGVTQLRYYDKIASELVDSELYPHTLNRFMSDRGRQLAEVCWNEGRYGWTIVNFEWTTFTASEQQVGDAVRFRYAEENLDSVTFPILTSGFLRRSLFESISTAVVLVDRHAGAWAHTVLVIGCNRNGFVIADPGHDERNALYEPPYNNVYQVVGRVDRTRRAGGATAGLNSGTAAEETPRQLHVHANCPLILWDSQSRRIGSGLNQIPGATYIVQAGENDETGVPTGQYGEEVYVNQALGDYRIEVMDAGSFTSIVSVTQCTAEGVPEKSGLLVLPIVPGVGANVSIQVGNTVSPEIMAEPADVTVPVGEPAELTVVATNSAPLYYLWEKDGRPVEGAFSPTFRIESAGPEDIGLYRAVISTGTDTMTSRLARVSVTGIAFTRPSISQQPLSQSFLEGSNVTFSVGAAGTPSLVYQWLRDGVPVVGWDLPRLDLFGCGPGDTAGYSVIVSNRAGAATSTVATLTMLTPPAITRRTPDQTMGVGGNITLTLQVGGTEPLTYQWYAGASGDTRHLIAGATGSGLRVTNVAETVSFWVRIQNGAGTLDSETIVLRVPPANLGANEFLPVTDGTITCIGVSGRRGYIGGSFTRVGEYTGSAVVFDSATGERLRNWPIVNGPVQCAIPDGAGGFYIGGTFSQVGSLVRNRVAHILDDGTVDPDFDVDVAKTYTTKLTQGGSTFINTSLSVVSCLSLHNDILYLGGSFKAINDGVERWGLAAVTATSGVATAFDPCVELDRWYPDEPRNDYEAPGAVRCVLATNNTVYFGGVFNLLNRQTAGGAGIKIRPMVAAVDRTTGVALPWNPNGELRLTNSTAMNALLQPRSMVIVGSALFVGGTSQSSPGPINIGGRDRLSGTAKIDLTSGSVSSTWNPSLGPYHSIVNRLIAVGSTLYVGGTTQIEGPYRALWALHPVSGDVLAWVPPLTAGGGANDMALQGSDLFVAGNMTDSAAKTVTLTSVNRLSGAVGAWTPEGFFDLQLGNSSKNITALAAGGGRLLVASDSCVYDTYERRGLAAWDSATGQLLDWAPNVGRDPSNPRAVLGPLALLPTENAVYVGGGFDIAGNGADAPVPRHNAAAFAPDTGTLLPWDPNLGGPVRAMLNGDGVILLGGDFVTVNANTPRDFLAAVDSINGLATFWNPRTDGFVHALAGDGQTVYAGGAFSTVNDTVPRNGIAAFDLEGNATDFDANIALGFEGSVLCLQLQRGVLYAGGEFSGPGSVNGGVQRDFAAAFDSATGAVTPWDPSVDGVVRAMAVSDLRAYLAGDFTHANTTTSDVPRRLMASFDTTNGVVDELVYLDSYDFFRHGGIDTLLLTCGSLLAGGEFNYFQAFSGPTAVDFDYNSNAYDRRPGSLGWLLLDEQCNVVITGMRDDHGTLGILLPTEESKFYRLERRFTLLEGGWESLPGRMRGTGGDLEIQVPQDGSDACFFRVVEEP